MAGYWQSTGPETSVTWKNPQFVAEGQRQSGGWYFRPETNTVAQWWGEGQGPKGLASANPFQSTQPSQPTAPAAPAMPSYNDIVNQQKSNISDLVGRYSQAISGLTPLPTALKNIESGLGLPALQTAATSLYNTLASLPQTALDRGRSMGLSQGQMQQYRAAEAEKLTPTVQDVTSRLTAGETEAARQLAAVQAGQEQQLLPFSMEGSLLPGVQSTLANLYSSQVGQGATSALETQKARQSQELARLQNTLAMSNPQVLSGGGVIWDPTTGRFTNVPLGIQTPAPSPSLGQPTLNTSAGGTINQVDPLGLMS